MRFHPADTMSLALFCLFSVIMGGILYREFFQRGAHSKQIIGFTSMLIIVSMFAAAGIFERYVFPLVPIFLFMLVGSAVAFGFSEFGRKVAEHRSLSILVGFQSFRLPLELILHHWAGSDVIPETMTWSGQNWDVITGILAVVIAPIANRSKAAVFAFNLIGSLLLLNVARVVIFSLPLPISWGLENPLQLPFHFPYILIAPLFVWPAFFAHVVLWRKMLSKNHVNDLVK